MNDKAARKLKIGDRVRDDDDECPGTVIEANWMAVKIQWDDDQVGILHHRDMGHISRLEERYDVTRTGACIG